MPCEVVSPLPFLRPAPFSYPTRMASSSPRTKLHGLGFTAVSPEATSSPPRSRKGSGAKKANGQRRSCPTSPSASFVSLHRMQAGMPPDPVCIRSRSSSHPHLSYTSSVFTPALDLGSPYFSLAPGYLGIVPMDDSDTERDQLMFGVHHSSTIGTTIGRMRHLPRLRSKDKLKRQDVTETETEREGPVSIIYYIIYPADFSRPGCCQLPGDLRTIGRRQPRSWQDSFHWCCSCFGYWRLFLRRLGR